MIILCGDHLYKSRQRLGELISTARSQSREVTRLKAVKLTVAKLEETLGSSSLFGQSQTLIIEGLHSLPTSTKKKDLIEILANTDKDSGPSVILWESRALTKTMLKKFSRAKVETFALSKSMFKWLDSLSPQKANKKNQLKLLHQTLLEENDFIAMTMLIRQIKLLLAIKAGGPVSAPPFVVRQLTSQARHFSEDQLISALQELLHLDYRYKQSATNLSLGKELDLLILKL